MPLNKNKNKEISKHLEATEEAKSLNEEVTSNKEREEEFTDVQNDLKNLDENKGISTKHVVS